jgi:hypothetical protein
MRLSNRRIRLTLSVIAVMHWKCRGPCQMSRRVLGKRLVWFPKNLPAFPLLPTEQIPVTEFRSPSEQTRITADNC